jgi:sialate O-acetylesterase
LLAACALGQELRVGAGIADYQVVQRNDRNEGTFKFGGSAEGLTGKAVEARLTAKGKVVKGWNWKPVATIESTTWSAEISGVPAGGPYQLELRAAGADPVVIRDLLVGDLWMLAGQSNMEGVGDLVDVQNPDPLVHSFDQSDRWGIAKEPLHELPGAVDRVHWRKNSERLQGTELARFREGRRKGAGLGLPFAVEMVKRTSIPVGLIPTAHGGTSMAQWDPALRDKGGESLYGAMFRRFQAVGGRVKGVLWYQGESDANPNAAPLYRQKFDDFIQAVRRDFGQTDLPFYYVQLGRFVDQRNQEQWNQVQEAQRLIEASVPRTGVVAAVDLTLDDRIHISTPGLKQLGVRLAKIATGDLFPNVKGRVTRGPRLASARYEPAAGNFGLIRVRYSGANGKLQAAGRISGFSVRGRSDEPLPMIFKTEIDPKDPASVLLHVQDKLPAGAVLYYGYGKDPYCNLRDEQDMAALASGPVAIEQ